MPNNPPIRFSCDLQHYLDISIRGIEQRACISEDIATAIKLADPDERLTHLELINQEHNLYWLYPISSWRESAARIIKQREQAEIDRQARFEKEEQAKAILKQTLEIETRKTNLIDNIARIMPKTYATLGRSLIIELTESAQRGEDEEWKAKLKARGIEI